MILGSIFQEKYLVRDTSIYKEPGILTKNEDPGAIPPKAFENVFNLTIISKENSSK